LPSPRARPGCAGRRPTSHPPPAARPGRRPRTAGDRPALRR
jgi:hypothetical protein